MSLLKSMFKAPKPGGAPHPVAKPAPSGEPYESGRNSPPPVELKEEEYPLLWKSYFDEARDVPLRVGTSQEAVSLITHPSFCPSVCCV